MFVTEVNRERVAFVNYLFTMGKLRNFIDLVKRVYAKSSSERYVAYIRKHGVTVGDNVMFWSPRTTQIDLTRSCLIEIGNDVNINTNFTIMTHDYSNFVFRHSFADYVNNCGKVKLGNNIYIGLGVTILRGVEIGDNCIIGAGSVVTKSIPANSVAVGVPCRVICSLEAYYKKRKSVALGEAKDYIRAFRRKYGRNPEARELGEEWLYFVDKRNIDEYNYLPIKREVGREYNTWLEKHQAPYSSYEEFMASID